MNEAACGEQLGWGTLVDYWLVALPPNEEDRVEEHLMGCDSCGARFEEVIGLCDGIRRVARSGVLRVIISESFLERAANAGLQVRQYSVPAGGSVNCTVKAEDDLLVGRLAIDLGSATQVDLSVAASETRCGARCDATTRGWPGSFALPSSIDGSMAKRRAAVKEPQCLFVYFGWLRLNQLPELSRKIASTP